MISLLAAAALSGCHVIDGDTIRCGRERVRLVGIDAPELHGCHPRGRHCAPGDPVASRDNLRRLLAAGPVKVERLGQDRYGRTVGVVRLGGVNASCAQLRGGYAIYRGDWDDLRAHETRIVDGSEVMREGWEEAGSPPIEINDAEADDLALMAAADFVLSCEGPIHVGETPATRLARQARRPN